jgi:hypothetical protein
LFKRYRKRGAIALAIIVSIELIAAAALVVVGGELIDAGSDRAKSQAHGTPALGFSASRSSPSIAVF